MDLAALHLELAALLPAIGGTVGAALLLYVLVTTLTTLSIPGVLIPVSATGGLLLGPLPAIAAVALGAVTGSLLLFLLTRRFGTERLRRRFGHRLAPLEKRMKSYGPAAVVALRVAGAPGPLITAGAAMTHMGAPVFLLATLAGLLPSVTLAASGAQALLG